MGKRGPAPAPTHLKLVAGVRQDRINENEPEAPAGMPVLPDGVSPEVAEVWEYTLGQLEQMSIVSTADRDPLLAYCEAVITHRKASQLLAKSPVLIKGLHGGLVRNPALQIQRDAATLLRGFAQEFGLTPSARSSIDAGGGARGGSAEDNPFQSGVTG